MVGDILQPTHLLFVLVVALLVLGPKRLPEAGRTLGNGLRDFRAAISGEPTQHDWLGGGESASAETTEVRHQPPVEAPNDVPVAAVSLPAEPTAAAVPVAATPSPAVPAPVAPAPAPVAPTSPAPASSAAVPARPSSLIPKPVTRPSRSARASDAASRS